MVSEEGSFKGDILMSLRNRMKGQSKLLEQIKDEHDYDDKRKDCPIRCIGKFRIEGMVLSSTSRLSVHGRFRKVIVIFTLPNL